MAKEFNFDKWAKRHQNHSEITYLFRSITQNILFNQQIEPLSKKPESVKSSLIGIDQLSNLLIEKALIKTPLYSTRKTTDLRCENYDSITAYYNYIEEMIVKNHLIRIDNTLKQEEFPYFKAEEDALVMNPEEYENLITALKYFFATVFFASVPAGCDTKSKEMFQSIPKVIVGKYKQSILNSFVIIIFFLVLTAMIIPTVLNFLVFYIAFFTLILYIISIESAKRFIKTYKSPSYTITSEFEVLGYRLFDKFNISVNNATIRKKCAKIDVKKEICGLSYQYPVWDFNPDHTEELIIDIAGYKVMMTLTSFDNTLFINSINGK